MYILNNPKIDDIYKLVFMKGYNLTEYLDNGSKIEYHIYENGLYLYE